MAESRWGGLGFGIYDFFAYILPSVLLIAPAIVLVEPFLDPWTAGIGATGRGIAEQEGIGLFEGAGVALFALALLYAIGLALHALSRTLEDKFRPKIKEGRLKGKRARPSELVLGEGRGGLNEPVPAQLHAQAAHDFGLPSTATDQQVWWLAYRYLAQEQLLNRTLQFLYLHNLTRALTLAALLWAAYFIAWGLVSLIGGIETAFWMPLVLGVGLSLLTGVFNTLRKGYDRSVAEEVFVAYYVARRTRR